MTNGEKAAVEAIWESNGHSLQTRQQSEAYSALVAERTPCSPLRDLKMLAKHYTPGGSRISLESAIASADEALGIQTGIWW